MATELEFTINEKVTYQNHTYDVGEEAAMAAALNDADLRTLEGFGYVTITSESDPTAPSESRTDVLDEGTPVQAEVGGIDFVGPGVSVADDPENTGRVIVTVLPTDGEEDQILALDEDGEAVWIDLPEGTPAITPTTDEGKVLAVVADAAAWTDRVQGRRAVSKLVPTAVGTSAFSWTPDYTVAGVPNTTELTEAQVIGNPKGATHPNDISQRLLVIVSDGPNEDMAGIRSYMYRDSASFSGGLLCRKARGSIASKAAIQSGDTLGSFQGMAYHGTDTLNAGWSANIVAVRLIAAENQTSTAAGTRVDFEVTRIGAAAKRRAVSIMSDGSIYAADILDAVATPTNASHFYSNDGKPAFKGEAGHEFLFTRSAHIADPTDDASNLTATAAILDALEAIGVLATS
jgi:hypothetical protein